MPNIADLAVITCFCKNAAYHASHPSIMNNRDHTPTDFIFDFQSVQPEESLHLTVVQNQNVSSSYRWSATENLPGTNAKHTKRFKGAYSLHGKSTYSGRA